MSALAVDPGYRASASATAPNQMQEVKRLYYLRGQVKEEMVRAYVIGSFALFQDSGYWVILHRNTGRSIGKHYLFNNALQYASRLERLFEWDVIDGKMSKDIYAELLQRILVIAKTFGVVDL